MTERNADRLMPLGPPLVVLGKVPVPKFKVAHLREQGQNMLIFPLDSSVHYKSDSDKSKILEELEIRAHAAGLAGGGAIAWEHGRSLNFMGPRPRRSVSCAASTCEWARRISTRKSVGSGACHRSHNGVVGRFEGAVFPGCRELAQAAGHGPVASMEKSWPIAWCISVERGHSTTPMRKVTAYRSHTPPRLPNSQLARGPPCKVVLLPQKASTKRHPLG